MYRVKSVLFGYIRLATDKIGGARESLAGVRGPPFSSSEGESREHHNSSASFSRVFFRGSSDFKELRGVGWVRDTPGPTYPRNIVVKSSINCEVYQP